MNENISDICSPTQNKMLSQIIQEILNKLINEDMNNSKNQAYFLKLTEQLNHPNVNNSNVFLLIIKLIMRCLRENSLTEIITVFQLDFQVTGNHIDHNAQLFNVEESCLNLVYLICSRNFESSCELNTTIKICFNWLKVSLEKMAFLKYNREFHFVITYLMFFQKVDYISHSIELIDFYISTAFKLLTSKEKENSNSIQLLDMTSLDYFEEMIKIGEKQQGLIHFDSLVQIMEDMKKNTKNKDQILYTRDLCVLYFIFNIKIRFIQLKEKYLSLLDNPLANTQSISTLQGNFKQIVYFQDSFLSYFSLCDIYKFFSKHKHCIGINSIVIKIESMLTLLISNQSKYFIKDKNLVKNIPKALAYRSLEEIRANIEQCLYNSNYKQWNLLFDINPYYVTLATLHLFSREEIQSTVAFSQMNYFDLDKIYTKLVHILPNDKARSSEILKIFVKCTMMIYLMFNNDMANYSFLLDTFDAGTQTDYIVKYNTEIILLLWKIKNLIPDEHYYLIKDLIEKLYNDIISERESCLIFLVHNHFDENLIKFILDNIESSHISLKYIDDLFNSKIPEKILNGLLLIGHWANTYPIKYIYSKILDVLFILQKHIDLRTVLTNEKNIKQFFKGIFLLFKAFPKASDEFNVFLCFVKKNSKNWISDYSLLNFFEKQSDRTSQFIENVLVKSEYYNPSTSLVGIKPPKP